MRTTDINIQNKIEENSVEAGWWAVRHFYKLFDQTRYHVSLQRRNYSKIKFVVEFQQNMDKYQHLIVIVIVIGLYRMEENSNTLLLTYVDKKKFFHNLDTSQSTTI